MKQRRVVCAAVRYPNVTLIGPRHYDSVMRDQFQAAKLTGAEEDAEQGFIDQHGAFLTRAEAWKVAEAAGQILYRCGGDTRDGGTLFSENLY